MDKKLSALLAISLLLLVSAGCVNRYSGCDPGNMNQKKLDGSINPDYSCCVPPGGAYVNPDASHTNVLECCPGTSAATFAGETGPHCHYTLSTYWGDWQYVALAAVLISAFLVSLAYMAGHIFGVQGLIVWAKNELFQVIASALIVCTLIGIIFVVQKSIADDIVSGGVACAGQNCHIELAQKYLDVVYWQASYMAEGIVRVTTILAYLRGLAFTPEQFAAPYFGLMWYPFSGLGVPTETLKTCLDILVKIMMLLKAQEMVLSMVEYGFFPIFLVMGIVFRSFFFTRKLGGLLIALAIGVYLVFPLVYVISHNVWLATIQKTRLAGPGSLDYYDKGQTTDPITGATIDPTIGSPIVRSSTGNDIEKVVYPDGTTQLDRLGGLWATSGGIGTTLGSYVNNGYLIGDGGILEKIGILLVYSTLIPFIALMTTIGFVRGLSSVLGGDIEIAGLTRVL